MQKNPQLLQLHKSIEQELMFSCSEDTTDENWLAVLSHRINELISKDFAQLVVILYHLDINESRLKQLLKDYPDTDAGMLIGELILKRQMQKVQTREIFRQDYPDNNEAEKW